MARPRPGSILWFERTVYLALGVNVVNDFIIYGRIRAAPPDPAHAPGIVPALLLVTLAVYALFVWLIAYRASNVVRWIFVGLTGIGFFGLLGIREIIAYGGASAALALVQYPLSALTIWLLFRRDANAWFAGRAPVDPEIFN